MIGVLGVIAILALALAPVLIKQLDQIAADKEAGQLKAFSAAFRQGILKSKSIPSQTGWDSMIATNLGLEISQVRTNDRHVARIFLIDPLLEIGVSGGKLPYTQGINGSRVFDNFGNIVPPINPRVAILSSISQPLPTNLVSGVASSSSAFSNIWEAGEGTVPVGWGWTGKGDDLKIQRINVIDLFIHLGLSQDAATPGSPGNFSIEGVGPTTIPSAAFEAYYLDGTQLGLYDRSAPPAYQYGEILHNSKSFLFVLGSWQGERFLGRTISRLTPVDLQRAANAFLLSNTNNCAANSGVTTWTAYYAMISYMSNYCAWCDSGWQGCTTFGNKNPSGTYGTVLNANQGQFGSQAYLNTKTTALICQQAN
jgi:type II secretory pathway pseudopilin PulG